MRPISVAVKWHGSRVSLRSPGMTERESDAKSGFGSVVTSDR